MWRCCRTVGLLCVFFCLGVIMALAFPIWIVAVMEAIMIIVIGYSIIFRWRGKRSGFYENCCMENAKVSCQND